MFDFRITWKRTSDQIVTVDIDIRHDLAPWQYAGQLEMTAEEASAFKSALLLGKSGDMGIEIREDCSAWVSTA